MLHKNPLIDNEKIFIISDITISFLANHIEKKKKNKRFSSY